MQNYNSSMLAEAQSALKEGDHEKALKLCNGCIKNDPDNIAALSLAAAIHAQNGHYGKAEKHYRKITQISSSIAEAWYYLAMTLVFQNKNKDEIIRIFKKSLDINPGFIPSWTGLGCIYRDYGDIEQAILSFHEALKIDPDNVEANINLGNVYRFTGEYDRSLECFSKISEKHPHNYSALSSLAMVKYQTGKINDAHEIINHVIKSGTKDPLAAQAYASIATTAEDMEQASVYISEVLKQCQLTRIQKSELLYSAGRLYDKMDRYNDAFKNIEMANRYSGKFFDINNYKAYANNITTFFDARFINERSLSEQYNIIPIFIAGMPRSGSSLVEQILSCHPMVNAGGEITMLVESLNNLCSLPPRSEKFPEAFSRLSTGKLAELAHSYMDYMTRIAGRKPYATDKLPTNYERLGIIKILFPQAVIIHTYRNPLDTCISCYFQNFGNNHTYTTDLDKLAKVYKCYRDIMQHWKNISDIRIFDLEYEALVNEPEQKIHELLRFCGLEWSDECLNFYQSERLTKTASYDQVRQPLYKKSINRYKNYRRHIDILVNGLS